MRVYVASKWEKAPEVRGLYEKLRHLGHEITYAWAESPAALSAKPAKDGDLPADEEAKIAEEDIDGVAQAEVVLVIGHPLGLGLWIEMGAALAFGLKVIVIPGARVERGEDGRIHSYSDTQRKSLFFNHPLVKVYDNWFDALIYEFTGPTVPPPVK